MTAEKLPSESANPLETLMSQYSASIGAEAVRHDLDPRVRNALFVTGGGLALTTFILGPSVIQGMTSGLTFPQALAAALVNQPLASTWNQIEQTTAQALWPPNFDVLAHNLRGFELSKFVIAWRAEISSLAGLGIMAGGVERFIHHRTVREGRANIKVKGEQMFVIGGSSSKIADVLKLDDPRHVIPFFEFEDGGKYLVAKLAPEPKGVGRQVTDRLFTKPVFVNLGVLRQQSHRELEAWQKVHPNESNLIHAVGGKKYLFLVGCGETPEEELQRISNTPDVTLEELVTDAEMLAARLVESGVRRDEFETFQVYLGSADTPRIDPETGEATLNDRKIAKKAGTDVYIDTWRSYIWGIKEELKSQEVLDKGIRLVTSVGEYRGVFEAVAKELGINLYTKENDPGTATLVAYEKISDETVHRAKQLSAEYEGRKVIALTSNIEDDKVARDQGINSVCSAVVIKNIIKAVKTLLKDGKSATDIQDLIDSLVGKPAETTLTEPTASDSGDQ